MAVALDGTGGFFTRAGVLLGGINQASTAVGATLTTRVASQVAQYASNEQDVFAPMWSARELTRGAFSSWIATQIDLANQTLVAQVDRDVPLPSLTVTAAATELIRQMKGSASLLNRPTVTAAPTADAGNVGNTVLATSVLDGDGLPLDCVFAESVVAVVTSDAGTGSTEFSETISVAGDTAVEVTDYEWPLGSGASTSLQTVDPATNGLLVNGDFSDWTVTNVPDDWTYHNSTVAGTHVTRQASPVRSTDQYNMRLTSDGAVLITVRQLPSSTLQSLTVYAATFSAKINTLDATGALRFALVDGTGTVINDNAGVANSSSLGVNGGAGVDTTYKQFTVFFRTPAKMPQVLSFEVKLTTAPTTGRLIDIDLVQLTAATQLYSGGPYVAAFSHSTSPIVGDRWTIAVANSLGNTSLIRGMDRLLGTRQRGLKFPSGSPTVADALVT